MLSSIFDPFGFVAPILVSPKLWLRELNDHDWDDEVSDAKKAQWQSWLDSLSQLEKLKVNRCLKPLKNVKVYEIHAFADGSQTGYGAISYLGSVQINGAVSCSFLMGKGYLAKERRTVPQVELLAAV